MTHESIQPYLATDALYAPLFDALGGNSVLLRADPPKYTILAATPQYLSDTGKRKEELLGKGIFEAFPANNADPDHTGESVLMASYAYVMEEKKAHYLPAQRYDLKASDGSYTEKYWRASNKPVLTPAGEVAYIIHTAEDVTDQVRSKRQDDKIRGLEAAHRLFMQVPAVIGITKGSDHELQLANESALDLWGKEADIIGKSLKETLPHLEEQGIFERFDEVLKTGRPSFAPAVPIITLRSGIPEIRYFDLSYQPYVEDGEEKAAGVFTLSYDVTEMVRAKQLAEEATNETNRQKRLYETISASIPDLIYVFSLDYKFTYANKALLDMWGATWETAVGKGLRENGYEPWHAEMHEREIDQVVAAKAPVRGEVSFPHATLGRRVYDYIFVPVFNEIGEVEAVAGTTRDITDIKLAEQAIRESTERFRHLADESPMFVFIIEADPMAPVSYWNKTWLEYTGQTAGEAAGRAWDGILHPEDVPIVMEHYVPAFEARQSYFIPAVRVKRHDGVYRWHAFKGNPRYAATGAFDGYVGVGFDIHEQKEAEEALKQSETRARLAVDSARLGTIDVNLVTGDIIYSERSGEIFGFDPACHYTYKEFTDAILPEDAPIRARAYEEAKRSGELCYEVRISRPDGGTRWIRLNGYFKIEKGVPDTFTGTLMDTTEEKRAAEILEQRIKERTRELTQVNEQLKQFTYAASHDLQEPLRKIGFFLDRLVNQVGPNLNEESRGTADRIQQTTKRMRGLIDDLLEYSNTSFGATGFTIIDLSEVVKGVLDDMEATLVQKGARVQVDSLPKVKGDGRQLRQLAQNLVGNALKYSKRDVPPLVSVTSRLVDTADLPAETPVPVRPGQFYEIQVKDNGIGFDPDDAERIFRLFQRLHGKAEYEGTGVGLAIVEKVVENHKGYIWAEGEPGVGATFTVLLPAQ
ncbi:MAG: domain S-box protein [Flaviaesturariibacter sp.]|nr:domain S-box protein [Flaviaesturariibacter sp.]